MQILIVAKNMNETRSLGFRAYGFSKNVEGAFLGGLHNQDYIILGSIFGSPFLCKASTLGLKVA